MSSFIKGLVGILLFGFASSSVKAQATFEFPLEVGNVWVYTDMSSSYPQCYVGEGGGCWSSRLRVVERVAHDAAVCGLIRNVISVYSLNNPVSRDYSISQTVLCQSDNRIYQFRNADSVPAEFEDQDMIADFNRSADQPWVVDYDALRLPEPPYTLRRMEEVPYTPGPRGQAGYSFRTYRGMDEQDLDHFQDYYTSYTNSFTSGVGFHQIQTHVLRSYFVGGVLVGDTTTVWPTSIDHEPPTLPAVARLTQAYPNPFNPSTVVGYQLTVVGKVRLSIHDLLGREVAVLVDEVRAPGAHQHTFDAAGLPSGIYLVVLDAAGVRDRWSITLLR